jgi:predicted 2-oxoglutarate/Fe(II)-dependent dioxygenase YbiX
MIIYNKPFLYFVWQNFFSGDDFLLLHEDMKLLEWENYDMGSYKYQVSCVYRYEQELIEKIMEQQVLMRFLSVDFVDKLGGIFNVLLSKCYDLTFHRMTSGDFSFRHTDQNSYGEKVRLVLYFSSPEDYEGGELNLYTDNDDNAIYCSYKLPANSVFGFMMTNESYHQVNSVENGVRLCLVITYI